MTTELTSIARARRAHALSGLHARRETVAPYADLSVTRARRVPPLFLSSRRLAETPVFQDAA